MENIYKNRIRDFFNENYQNNEKYWWKNDNRYSIDESVHTPYYRAILRFAKELSGGSVLDLGAGEGADSIRLAKLGLEVDAIEMSHIAVEKIKQFAIENKVTVNVSCCDIEDYIPLKEYDIVMCNGVLHYIKNKEKVVQNMQNHTRRNGINCISLFSTYTPIPDCHKIVPVFPDEEGGIIEKMYSNWTGIFHLYDRNKPELSHDDMVPHVHSFIKGIWRKDSNE